MVINGKVNPVGLHVIVWTPFKYSKRYKKYLLLSTWYIYFVSSLFISIYYTSFSFAKWTTKGILVERKDCHD